MALKSWAVLEKGENGGLIVNAQVAVSFSSKVEDVKGGRLFCIE